MSDSQLVPAYAAKNFIDAQLLRGLLVSEDIQALIPGEELNDEFALSARMAGTLGTTVLVPADQLAQAQIIVAAWQAKLAENQDR